MFVDFHPSVESFSAALVITMSRDRDTGKALQCASATGEVTERGSIDVGRCSWNVTITMLAFRESRAPIEVTRRKRCSALYQFPPPTLAAVTTLGPAKSSSSPWRLHMLDGEATALELLAIRLPVREFWWGHGQTAWNVRTPWRRRLRCARPFPTLLET